MRLYDYGLSTLEQYGLTAKTTSRIRGALLCHTEEGILVLKEFSGSEKKLLKQQELLLSIQEKGGSVDSYLANKEGSLISRDKDNIPYTLQRWYDGKECDTKSREDIQRGVRTLAGLHKIMKLPLAEEYMGRSWKRNICGTIRSFVRSVNSSAKKALPVLLKKNFHPAWNGS